MRQSISRRDVMTTGALIGANALLGLMASAGLTQNDVNVQQVGPVGVWQFVAEGKSQGMAGVPDWIPPITATGVKVKVIPSEQFFPHLAQGIGASDDTIKNRPDLVRKFVHAALHGMQPATGGLAEICG